MDQIWTLLVVYSSLGMGNYNRRLEQVPDLQCSVTMGHFYSRQVCILTDQVDIIKKCVDLQTNTSIDQYTVEQG